LFGPPSPTYLRSVVEGMTKGLVSKWGFDGNSPPMLFPSPSLYSPSRQSSPPFCSESFRGLCKRLICLFTFPGVDSPPNFVVRGSRGEDLVMLDEYVPLEVSPPSLRVMAEVFLRTCLPVLSVHGQRPFGDLPSFFT